MSGASIVTIRNLSLASIIAAAFRIRRNEIVGPGWIGTRNFDIEAKVPSDAPRGSVNEMLQVLLVERFALRFHREMKVQAGYALLVAAGGSRLRPSVSAARQQSPTEPMKMTKKLENAEDGTAFRSFKLKDAGLPVLAQKLSIYTDAPVVDMTGLQGKYDIDLGFSPSKNDAEFNSPGTSLAHALKEKGLVLKRQKVSRPLLIIDRLLTDPSAN